MTCKDCIHSGLCYKENDYDNFPDRCGSFIPERPQGELKEYKPFEVDYNVKSAVDNLKTAYWSNDSEKYAQVFTEAEDMIIGAICHYGYTVYKQPQGEWITTRTMVHDGNPYCSICDEENIIRTKFCPNCGAMMQKGGKE